jgi:sugar phosphate isomerase/epimerase
MDKIKLASRRQFLQTSLLAAAGVALGASCGNQPEQQAEATDKKNDPDTGVQPSRPVGIQFYTIPLLLQKDFKGTLKTLADIGYKEIEFAGPYPFSAPSTINGWKAYAPATGMTDSGFYHHSPQEVKKMMDDLGLTAPSAHVALADLREKLDEALVTARRLGQKYIICPYLEAGERKSIDDYKKLAAEFNRFGETSKKSGVQFGYHNHCFEFGKLDGQVPYDVLLTETDPELVKMELDLYWTHISGVDPIAYFQNYPNRFPLCHFKDMARKMTLSDPLTALDNKAAADSAGGNMADLGRGVIDFKPVIQHAQEAGLQHFFVERDISADPLTTLKEGYKYMSSILS